ncbi:hypothetical protein, partial [Streptomyces scabiei]|uniref:hypothetical protein n=7 Tax=Streptomyces scabiei TaxID=1930 RepID=UPI0038D38514
GQGVAPQPTGRTPVPHTDRVPPRDPDDRLWGGTLSVCGTGVRPVGCGATPVDPLVVSGSVPGPPGRPSDPPRDALLAADVPGTAAQAPEVPGTAPQAPRAPVALGASAGPAGSGDPETSGDPEGPGAPDVPRDPAAPVAPGAPGVPDTSGTSGAPSGVSGDSPTVSAAEAKRSSRESAATEGPVSPLVSSYNCRHQSSS